MIIFKTYIVCFRRFAKYWNIQGSKTLKLYHNLQVTNNVNGLSYFKTLRTTLHVLLQGILLHVHRCRKISPI